MEFKHFVRLIAIGLQAGIPMHMTGFPGVGKTEFAKSLETGFTRAGVKCKVMILIGSIREPQDFGGFPVSTPDGVRLMPMAWARDAQRLAADGYLVVVFLDELTTVPPTTQAAMLRLLTENVCGELPLPGYEPGKGGVVYLCASNAVEWAAGGQDIQPPMANRLWHGAFPMDHETWCDMMVSDFPAPSDLPVLPPTTCTPTITGSVPRSPRTSEPPVATRGWRRRTIPLDAAVRGHRVARGTWRPGSSRRSKPSLRAIARSRAQRWPVSWAIRRCRSSRSRESVNLPDPEDILKNPRAFVLPDRVDRAYAVCYSLAGAVLNNNTPQRWEAAMIALGVACKTNAEHPDRGGAYTLRQEKPPRGPHEVAGGVPSVLRADAAGEARAQGLTWR